MNLVIDIPKDMYIDANILLVKEMPVLKKIIANGTPLNNIRAEIESLRKEASNKHSEDAKLQAYYDGLNDGLKDARDTLERLGW